MMLMTVPSSLLTKLRTCGYCGTIHTLDGTVFMKNCSACKMRSYCSVECQKLDWPEHKKHCKKLALKRKDRDFINSVILTEELPEGYGPPPEGSVALTIFLKETDDIENRPELFGEWKWLSYDHIEFMKNFELLSSKIIPEEGLQSYVELHSPFFKDQIKKNKFIVLIYAEDLAYTVFYILKDR